MGSSREAEGPLWALKSVAVVSPWPLYSFWNRYLFELLCIDAPVRVAYRFKPLRAVACPIPSRSIPLPAVTCRYLPLQAIRLEGRLKQAHEALARASQVVEQHVMACNGKQRYGVVCDAT